MALFTPIYIEAQPVMSLKDCIDYAVAHNVQVKQQDVVRRNQEIALNTARFSRLPSVSASGSQSFDFGRGLTSENTYISRNTQSTAFSVNANMPLFTGFRIPNEIKQARLDLAAATADLEKVRDDLSIQVAQAYLEVLYQHDMLKVAEEQLALSSKQLERVQAFFGQKKSSALDVAQARSLVAQDDLSLVQARNNYKLALLDLSQLIEWPSPDSLLVTVPTGEPPAQVKGSPAEIFERALAVRPDVRADSLRVASADKGVSIAKSGYWPGLTLGAGLGTTFYRVGGVDNSSFARQMRDNFSKSIALSLNIPIFNRLSTRNSVRQARLEVENRKWQMETTRKNLYKEIQQAWYNAVASQSKYESSRVAEEEAETAFQLMTKKYETGKANAVEYEESRTQRQKAKSDRIAARYDYIFRLKILDFYRGIPFS